MSSLVRSGGNDKTAHAEHAASTTTKNKTAGDVHEDEIPVHEATHVFHVDGHGWVECNGINWCSFKFS